MACCSSAFPTAFPDQGCVALRAEMRIGKEHVGTYAEPVEPGMPLPREKKKKDK